MERRFGAILGTLLAALLLIGAFIVVNMTGNAPSRAEDDTPAMVMRQVTVVGRGEVRAPPDTAHVNIGVQTEAKTVQEALEANNEQASQVMEEIMELGVEEKDIQTRDFSIYPRYDDKGRKVVGYEVSNVVAVTIRELGSTGTLLDQVVQVGANRVYGIQFRVDDPSQVLDEARGKAMDDAARKAGQLAESGGATLGQVLVITENVGAPPPVMQPRMAMPEVMEEEAAAVPVQAGEQQFSVRVQVTYELE